MDRNEAKSANERAMEEAIYQAVAEEIASGVRRDGLWAKALAETGGSLEAAKARYIQLRAQSMTDDVACAQAAATPPPTTSARKTGAEMPPGVKGWSWGAFLLNWMWAIGNKTWWGTLAMVPYLGFLVALYLGFRGRELAWKNKQWASYEEFDASQKRWSFWGVALVSSALLIGTVAAIALPAYQDYRKQANTVATQTIEAAPEATPAQNLPIDEATGKAHLDAIYRAHPDADQIFNSFEFMDWLAKNEAWVETIKSGTADQVISMFNSFKSEPKAAQGALAQPQPPSYAPITDTTPQASARTKPFGSRDDVRAALQRARADYPYLATAEGKPVEKLILNMAENMVQREGYHSADAVAYAVSELAPSHEPTAAPYRAPYQRPVTAEADQVNEPPRTEKTGRPCRMVSTSPISFQCD